MAEDKKIKEVEKSTSKPKKETKKPEQKVSPCEKCKYTLGSVQCKTCVEFKGV